MLFCIKIAKKKLNGLGKRYNAKHKAFSAIKL